MIHHVLRAAILDPHPTGRIRLLRDGVLAADERGRIVFLGDWAEFSRLASTPLPVQHLSGILTPPFLDAHIHIPQFPIRGHFAEGVEELADGGRLLAGLQRNVFPAEAMAADPGYATECVRQFRQGTLSKGVVGGAAYMTVHAKATEIALRELAEPWSVGMVLMNQNCPEYLRTDEPNFERDTRHLAREFGPRHIVTDRFAVAVNSELRRRAATLARELGLRMQTHLNEQRLEKQTVEQKLYPGQTYTGVYHTDGLLSHRPILAHCIWMTPEEWPLVRDSGSVIAHCPTSNSLLGSGVMNLEEVKQRNIPWSLCTDVGASPTTSMLCEMAEFLRVHDGLHPSATAEEALYRSTLAPAQILGLDRTLGSFDIGKPLSFIEIDPAGPIEESSAEEVIRRHLLDLPPLSSTNLKRSTGVPPVLTTLRSREPGDSSTQHPQHGRDARATLEHSNKAPASPPHRELRLKLAAEGLTSPKDMDALAGDVQATINKLDRKVRQVVLNGQEVWRRKETQ